MSGPINQDIEALLATSSLLHVFDLFSMVSVSTT